MNRSRSGFPTWMTFAGFHRLTSVPLLWPRLAGQSPQAQFLAGTIPGLNSEKVWISWDWILYVTICYGNCSSVSWLSHGKGIKSVKASQSYQAPVDLCRPFQFPPRNLQSWLMELPLAKKKRRENMKTPSSCLVIGFLAILSFLSLDHNRIMILQECQCSAFIRAC